MGVDEEVARVLLAAVLEIGVLIRPVVDDQDGHLWCLVAVGGCGGRRRGAMGIPMVDCITDWHF